MANFNETVSSPPNTYHISPADQHEYTTMQGTVAFIERKYSSHIHDGGTQFIALLNLPEDKYQAFEAKREERTLPSMRVHYYPSHATAIIKLAGHTHEITSRELCSMIRDTFLSFQIRSNILQPRGASRQVMVDGSSKEPDDCWVPRLTRSRDDFPSFVVEIGVSESLPRLRVDACIWLETGQSLTRLVLLVSVDEQNQVIRMERWERVANPNGMHTRSQNLLTRSQCVQAVTIDAASNTVTNAPLLLPIQLILDAPIQLPAGSLPANQIFSIPAARLWQFANDAFF